MINGHDTVNPIENKKKIKSKEGLQCKRTAGNFESTFSHFSIHKLT